MSNEYMLGLAEEIRDYLRLVKIETKENYLLATKMVLKILDLELTPEQEEELLEINAGYYGFEF